MNAPAHPRSIDPRRARLGRPVCARAPIAAGLALAALLAVAGGAAASTADGVAYGRRVDLSLTGIRGDTTRIVSGPETSVEVAAPPADVREVSAGGSRVDGPDGLGTLLSTGRTAVNAAASAEPDLDHAAAGVLVDDVRLSLAGLLTLTAGRIVAEAEVVPEDGESCWSGTLGGGLASFQKATLGGSLVPVPIALPPGAPPDFVLFDLPGTATVTLNEQVDDGGRISVHAVHVELHELNVLGVGTLRGHVYLGHAEAVLACGGADVSVAVGVSGKPTATGEPTVYTATVSNRGPERAIDLLVDLPLSAALDPQSAFPSQGSCAIAGGTVTCSLGDLRVGEQATVEVVALPVHCGAIAIPADAAAANHDPAPGDNHDCGMVQVPGPIAKGADLEIEVADSADPVYVGQLLTYTVMVRHGGGLPVPAALATLDLPWGTWLLSAVPARGSCTGDRTVVCDLGPMTAGEQVPVTVTTLVLTSGALEAGGFVSSELAEPAVGDNYRVELTEAKESGA